MTRSWKKQIRERKLTAMDIAVEIAECDGRVNKDQFFCIYAQLLAIKWGHI